MNHKIEMDVYVLAAGKQTRFMDPKSKLMVRIHDKPAFHYTMRTLLSVFPEESIMVVTSLLFPDFVEYLQSNYPHSRVKIDDNPGSGTAKSLAQTFPWSSERAFVTEADIFFTPDLIKEQIETTANDSKLKACISVSPQINVASSHRGVKLYPDLEIEKKGEQNEYSHSYRNVGAYLLHKDIEQYINESRFNNLIDVIIYMFSIGERVVANAYIGAYLHMASLGDIKNWEQFINQNSNYA